MTSTVEETGVTSTFTGFDKIVPASFSISVGIVAEKNMLWRFLGNSRMIGVSEELETCSGEFFNLTTLEEPAPPALDDENASVLWEISLKMGNLNE